MSLARWRRSTSTSWPSGRGRGALRTQRGRTGPGAGRPSKLYRPGHDEVAASVPERHYDLAGSLLATAVAESTRTGARCRLPRAAARTAGRRSARTTRDASEDATPAMTAAPTSSTSLAHTATSREIGDDEEIALVNCPFHRLAEEHRELVCGMNLDFLDGLLDGIGPDDGLTASLEPEPGYCCVRIGVD